MIPQRSRDSKFSTKGVTGAASKNGRTKVEALPFDKMQRPDVPHEENAAPLAGEMLCDGCHAIYANKHWHVDEKEYALKAKSKKALMTTCPGCKAIADRQYQGELTILGPPPKGEIDERRQRIFDTEARARRMNPMARVAELQIEPGKWHLYTTSWALAHRIGKELKKAFGGELIVDKLREEAFCRVKWIEGPKHVD